MYVGSLQQTSSLSLINVLSLYLASFKTGLCNANIGVAAVIMAYLGLRRSMDELGTKVDQSILWRIVE